VSLHPFREPLGAAFIVAKGTVGSIPDAPHLILAHVAKLRDLFSRKKDPGVVPRDFKKRFLIKWHRVLLSSGKGWAVSRKHASHEYNVFTPVNFGHVRQQHELAYGKQQAGEATVG
jgi:hypothetical protein